jgi:hypothetical protein
MATGSIGDVPAATFAEYVDVPMAQTRPSRLQLKMRRICAMHRPWSQADWGWRKRPSRPRDASRYGLGWRIAFIHTVCMCAQKLSCNATDCYLAL